jgi:hypothetical protein
MGLFKTGNTKSKAINFAKEQVKDEIHSAVEDKVSEVVVEKSLDYAIENVGSAFLPWWVMIIWWPIKQIALLITWPIRILLRTKK